MTKRLNPHRRLLARQAKLRASLIPFSDTDRGMLQQGVVRSPLNPRVQLTAYSVPRGDLWEGRGKRVRKVAPKPKAAQIVHGDSLRMKANRVSHGVTQRQREKKHGIKLDN